MGRQTFAYDAVGNRLSKSEPSGLTQYGYGANNHRLDSQTGTINRSYQYDAAGHLLNEGSLGFVYDNSGRLLGAHLSGTPISVYLHNALDQRVAKLTVNGPSVFVYDEAGRTIGDYSESRLTETIWLDDIPVALLKSQSNGSVALAGYIHTDHLGTPRKITDPSSNTLIWQWQGAPFGETAANDDPDGDGNHLAFNLRFPGQYYDTETGKHYNVHRNYDPALGRYIQSDPIGLAGGINTYTYVENNPVNWIDPLGLAKKNNKLPQSSYFDCDAADLEQCAKKCGSADNVERCVVRITPKIKCITSDGTQLTEDKVETLCECKGDDVNPIENEPNPVIIPIKPLPLLRLPVPVLVPIIP